MNAGMSALRCLRNTEKELLNGNRDRALLRLFSGSWLADGRGTRRHRGGRGVPGVRFGDRPKARQTTDSVRCKKLLCLGHDVALRLRRGAGRAVQRAPEDVDAPPWLEPDLRRIEKATGFGFFLNGPRLWMVGGVEPLEALQDPAQREPVIRRIVAEYPAGTLAAGEVCYRIRKGPARPDDAAQYDSPPATGGGRLDTPDNPVMYGSQDVQVCIHECRVTAEDELYVASLAATRDLKLLDLTHLLYEEHVTEFDSLDMAVHMLFLAGPHSYEITWLIAHGARAAGYDSVIYPAMVLKRDAGL
jgi:hypothetical protein